MRDTHGDQEKGLINWLHTWQNSVKRTNEQAKWVIAKHADRERRSPTQIRIAPHRISLGCRGYPHGRFLH